MTQEYSFTPTSELMQEWLTKWRDKGAAVPYDEFFAAQAAQWGADQELEACCEWVTEATPWAAYKLRAARRPKPLSLREQALDELQLSFGRGYLKKEGADIIRRALESLPD